MWPIGHPILVEKIAEVYGPKLKRNINPMTEIIASNGANSAINILIQSLVDEGEEVVAFEPLFPPYLEYVQYSKGVFKGVPLEYKD